jgi:chromosome segregation ATPase
VTPAVEEIQRSLGELTKQLEGAKRLQPRLKTYFEEREGELSRVREMRTDVRRRIDDLLAQSAALRGASSLDDRRSRTIGRISAVVEGLEVVKRGEDVEQELGAVMARLDALRARCHGGRRTSRSNIASTLCGSTSAI